MEYVPIYTPGSLSESAFIESLIIDNGVRYYINNEVLSRLYVPQGPWRRAIYVHPKDYLLGRELLKDLLIDKPIPQKVLDQISEEETAPVEMSAEDKEASRYRIITISLLVVFAFYVLYKISSAG